MNQNLSPMVLAHYVSLAYDMEKNIYEQEKVISDLQREIRTRSSHCEPAEPTKPAAPEEQSGGGLRAIAGLILLFTLGPTSGLAGIIGIGLIVNGIYKAVNDSETNHKARNEFTNRTNWYQRSMEQYRRDLQAYRADQTVARQLKSRLPALQRQLTQNRATLRNLYSKGVIYEGYRNLIAVSSFRDYLMSGRCSTLQGHEGAYNIFALESRLDRLITQMDQVLRKLDQIQYSQNSLYRAVNTANDNLNRIHSSIDRSVQDLNRMGEQMSLTNSQLSRLNCNVELSRFEQEQTRKEIEFRNKADGYNRAIAL